MTTQLFFQIGQLGSLLFKSLLPQFLNFLLHHAFSKRIVILISFVSSFLLVLAVHGLGGASLNHSLAQTFPTQRDVNKWPFSSESILNMPIGSNAVYTPQPINPDHIDGVMTDLNIIVLTPDAEPMNVYGTEYLWQPGTTPETRCVRRNILSICSYQFRVHI